MSRNPPEGVSVGLGDDENIFNWEIMLVGPPDTLYEGGFFKCVLEFPPNFPNMPPKMTFKSEMWHPNGTCLCVCAIISRRCDCVYERRTDALMMSLRLQCTRTASCASRSSTRLVRTS